MIILVEDMLSAERLRQAGMRSMCLLGTEIHNNTLNRLIELYPDRVVLALDSDATAKAVKWKMQIGYLFKRFDVWPLNKDIKDMTKEEFSTLLREVNGA